MRLHLVSDESHNSERPKLGLGYLGSYLKKYLPDIQVSLSFANEDLATVIREIKPDIVGFSALTPKFNDQILKAKQVKDEFNLPVILGGVHLTLAPESLPEWVDVGVLSEGEEVLLKLLREFQKTKKLKNKKIPGLVFWDEGKLVRTGEALLVEPIDKIPPPDWDLLKVGPKGPGHIMTSRGCPFHCRFCEAGNFWKKYRLHSPERVVEEIELIYRRYHRRELVIMDDLFFINQARIEKIADLLKAKGLDRKMRFEVIGRADLFNEKVAKTLAGMSVFAISFGMESGSERILKYLKNDTVTLEQIRQAVKLAKKYRMEVLGTFMVGTPGETEDDIQKTVAFIKELDLDQVGINVTTPFPGTELWQVAQQKGLVKNNQWDNRLWAMRDVNRENVEEKLLLTDLPKEKFLALSEKLFALQDWTHRRRKNQQLFYGLVKQKSPLSLMKFIAHSFKRPGEAMYNLRNGYFSRY